MPKVIIGWKTHRLQLWQKQSFQCFMRSKDWQKSSSPRVIPSCSQWLQRHTTFATVLCSQSFLSPRVVWCFSGEDQMKRLRQLSAFCFQRLAPWDATGKILTDYRIAQHFLLDKVETLWEWYIGHCHLSCCWLHLKWKLKKMWAASTLFHLRAFSLERFSLVLFTWETFTWDSPERLSLEFLFVLCLHSLKRLSLESRLSCEDSCATSKLYKKSWRNVWYNELHQRKIIIGFV